MNQLFYVRMFTLTNNSLCKYFYNDEWQYDSRREMQEIVPGLFLGPYSAAAKNQKDNLKCHGITHILCVRSPIEARFVKHNFEEHLIYKSVELYDSATENIITYIPIINKFIEETLSRFGKVLVHGVTGMSRSAALVIAYIMETFQTDMITALKLVQVKRRCVSPNEGFMMQLHEYEAIYKAKQAIFLGPVPFILRNKRKYDEIEDN